MMQVSMWNLKFVQRELTHWCKRVIQESSTQRPRAVIDRLTYYYEHENSNVHRGAHALAARSTDAYENARQTVADFIGTAANKASVLSFKLDGYSDEEVGNRLNNYGIAVRTGHHCAQPVLRHFGYEGSVRPTLALYNSPDDIDALVKVLKTFA